MTGYDPHPRPSTPAGRVGGLDGLRAVAVIGVLLYHGEVSWAQGGFLGVDIFFVLSGYLVGSMVLGRLQRQGSLQFGRFWSARLRRLAPPQLALIVVTVVVVALWHRDEVAELRGQVLAALTATSNWYLLANGDSYFDQLGRPPLLRHLWSLAIELQFYLVFPVALAAAWPRLRHRLDVLTAGLLGAVLLSAIWMAILFDPGGDPSRAYFDSFARIQAPLLGAALAMVWRPRRLGQAPVASHGARYTVAAGAALVVLLLVMGSVDDRTALLYRGGFTVVALLAVVVVAGLTHPNATLGGRMGLGHPVLVAIGVRSYGLYLWHWPVFALLRPRIDVGWSWGTTFTVRILVTVVLTELCYRLVERPWHQRSPSTSAAGLRELLRNPAGAAPMTRALGATALVGVLATVGVMAIAREPRDAIGDSLRAGEAELARASETSPTSASSTTVAGAPGTPGPTTTTTTPPSAGPGPVTLVGDSVMVGAAPTLFDTFGDRATIDAEVARQAGSIPPVLRQLDAEGRLGPTVVVQVGINGTVTADDLRDIAEAVAGRRLFVLNARVPRSWEGSNNDTVANVVPVLTNASVIDWYDASNGRRDYFLDDGIHLTDAGRDAYASLIKSAVDG